MKSRPDLSKVKWADWKAVNRPIDWGLWTKLSQDALKQDDCLEACSCVRQGWYNCDCEHQDFLKWDQDVLYHRKFQPRSVRSVNRKGFMVMKEKTGYIEGPYLYSEWLEYSWQLFDKVHDVLEGKLVPNWNEIHFRHEDDFYSGIYSHFYQIFQVMICQLEGVEVKHGASNDVSRGANLYETLLPKDLTNHKSMEGKGEMHTVPRIHREFATEIHKKQVSDFDVTSLQNQLIAKSKANSKRVRLIRKHNKIRKNKVLHYRPPVDQNFDQWYFPLKQTPVWFSYKTQKWQYPPVIETNARLEKAQERLINKTILKWLKTGALYLMPEGELPDLATPSVFANVAMPGMPPPDPTKKERLCHHGGFEKAIEGYSLPCKLEDLYSILLFMQRYDKVTKSDDKSGFHLVKLSKESRKLVAFKYKGRFFTYKGCVFGSPPVPAIFQRANMIVMNYLRTLGVRNSLYLDDRLTLDSDRTIYNGVPRNGWATAAMVVAAGGFLSLEKSDFEPKMVQDFLGLRINTETCEVSVPETKWKALKEKISNVLTNGSCSFHEIQQIRGKCVSLILTNPMTKLFIREMNRVIAQGNKDGLLKTDIVRFDAKLKTELSEWLKLHFLKMRNKFVHTTDNDEDMVNRLTFTDASSFSASAVVFTEKEDADIKQWFFDEKLQAEPIFVKEGLAILWMLTDFRADLSSKRIIHFCDNQVVVHTYNGLGTKTENLQDIIRSIYIELDKMGSKLVLYWINTHNQLADEASRFIDYNEEFIPSKLYSLTCNNLGVNPTVDAFATAANTKCPRYITFGLSGDPNCIGFDFFTIKPADLLNEILWIFPPKNQIQHVMAHLARYYENHRYLLVFHSFGETPLGLPLLLQQGGKLSNFLKFPASIIPAEKELYFMGQLFYGFWNQKVRATKILRMNC